MLDGILYFEFPNSTAMTTTHPKTNASLEFMLVRGVRSYTPRIGIENGQNSLQNYVSDVLLFERINGEYFFRNRLLSSLPENTFFFEDPRISVIHDKNGKIKYLLSGTDYSPHVEGATNPDVMNRYVELKLDSHGRPKPVRVNKFGKPYFKNLSPFPLKLANGDMVYTDAKNGTITKNELGQLVVRTRLRPDFNSHYIADLMAKSKENNQPWSYAEQVFVFKNWQEFEAYNWNDSLLDLFGDTRHARLSEVHPLSVKTIITDKDLKEHLTSNQEGVIVDASHKGLGPGIRPLRIRRHGSEILLSEGPNAREFLAGKLMAEELNTFALADNTVIFLTFDHEIRYVKQLVNNKTFVRRHYSASVKIFDHTLSNMTAYLADVIQPKTIYERGFASGIIDLQHVYPMGWALTTLKGKAQVRVYAGASDAHTALYSFDVVKLLRELKI